MFASYCVFFSLDDFLLLFIFLSLLLFFFCSMWNQTSFSSTLFLCYFKILQIVKIFFSVLCGIELVFPYFFATLNFYKLLLLFFQFCVRSNFFSLFFYVPLHFYVFFSSHLWLFFLSLFYIFSRCVVCGVKCFIFFFCFLVDSHFNFGLSFIICGVKVRVLFIVFFSVYCFHFIFYLSYFFLPLFFFLCEIIRFILFAHWFIFI